MEKHLKYINIAKQIATFSKDPSTKVGAIIVSNNDNRIISTGYNGFIKDCNESLMTFEKPLKYHLTIHAEMNCLLFAKRDLCDTTLYITHSPCENCLKNILQCSIKTIYYDTLYNKYTEIEIKAINLLINSVKDINIVNINNNKTYLQELGLIIEDEFLY